MFGAPVEGVANLGAEAGLGQGGRFARDCLTVEPGRTRCRDLLIHAKIGAHRECGPALTARIIEFAQLDNRSRCAVASRLQIGKLDVMGASVDAVDNGIGRADQFVIEPTIDQPADNRRLQAFRGQDIIG